MKHILFKSRENIYKANLHCHTTVSDGKLTPEKIKEIYRAKGYSIVAFSDHRKLKAQAHLNDDSFLAINACEVDLNQTVPGVYWEKTKTYHFNLYATSPDMIKTPPGLTVDYNDIGAINQYIKDRTDEGFLVCYNHPYWSLQDCTDYCGLKGLFAMEIYNNGCELDGYYGYHPQAYDEMLRSGQKLYCISADDNHNRQLAGSAGFDSFGGFVMVNSVSLRYTDVMDALKRGDFYASQGPEIHEIFIEKKKLTVKCSDASLIAVFTDGRNCYLKHGEAMNTAELTLTEKDKYIRVMVRDKDKKDANSRAFWL